MGFTLTIGLYAEQQKLPDLTAALYRRLLARGSFVQATLHGRYRDPLAEPTFQYFSEEQLHSLATEIVLIGSDKSLDVEVAYQLISGRWLSLDLNLQGPWHLEGRKLMVEEQLTLDFEAKDLYRPFRAFMEEEGLSVVPEMEVDLLGHEVASMLQSKREADVYESARELFLRACGLAQHVTAPVSPSQCSDFEHAVMYSDYGYGSLVSCSAIFHQDPSEFARDFLRIYLEYNQGMHLPLTLAPGADLVNLHIKPQIRDDRWGIGIPGKVNPSYYPYEEYDKPETHDQIIQFLERLSEGKVRQLATLSGEQIRQLLSEMVAGNTVPGITVHDFGDCGLAVFTQPLLYLWRVYQYIADRSIESATA